MTYNLDQIQFGADAISIVEDELNASFSDDVNDTFMDLLYREYLEAGSPKRRKTWLRTRLKHDFACIEYRPNWIEKHSLPVWPFFQGRPMVFIRQFEVPPTENTNAGIVPRAMLYIFGIRVDANDGWTTQYEVVEQLPGLP